MNRVRTMFTVLVLTITATSALAQDSTDTVAEEAIYVAPLDSIRNYHPISDVLTTGGQVGYDQVPLLRDAGFQTVINLATASEEYNAMEGFHVSSSGLTYVQIPVVWGEPTLDDVEQFFNVMEANQGRKVYVHCVANMRGSAFSYLYRVLVDGVDETEARRDLNAVWDPAESSETWQKLIDDALASPRFAEKSNR